MTADTEPTDTADKPDYDSPWKEALERFFPEFLALLFPAIHAEIDWSKGVQFLDKEFQLQGQAHLGMKTCPRCQGQKHVQTEIFRLALDQSGNSTIKGVRLNLFLLYEIGLH